MSLRRYFVEFGASFLAYAGTLFISNSLLAQMSRTSPWRLAVALLPMIPACAPCWAILRQLRRLDELRRRLQLEALAMAVAGTALVTFSYGFLERVGYPKLSMFAVWPIMATFWGVGLFVSNQRFR